MELEEGEIDESDVPNEVEIVVVLEDIYDSADAFVVVGIAEVVEDEDLADEVCNDELALEGEVVEVLLLKEDLEPGE